MAQRIEEIKNSYHSHMQPKFEQKNEFYDSLNIILCSIIIIVNFFVVLSTGFLIQKGQQPRATYIYLANISLSDMIIGIVALFINLCPNQLHKELLCSTSISLATAASLASVFSIGLIAIDRYLYIVYGLHYHRYITTKHSPCMVSLIWFLGVIFGSVPIFIWKSPMEEHACWFIALLPPKFAIFLVLMGIIPMVLIFVLYSIILKNALESLSRMHCNPVNNSLETQSNDLSLARFVAIICCRRSSFKRKQMFCESKWKAVKIVVFTAGAFFITWFPSFVTWIFYAYYCDLDTNYQHCENLEYMLSNPLSLLSLSNSLLNPLIYAWWHQGFREPVKKMYSKLFGKIFEKPLTSSSSEPKIQQTETGEF